MPVTPKSALKSIVLPNWNVVVCQPVISWRTTLSAAAMVSRARFDVGVADGVAHQIFGIFVGEVAVGVGLAGDEVDVVINGVQFNRNRAFAAFDGHFEDGAFGLHRDQIFGDRLHNMNVLFEHRQFGFEEVRDGDTRDAYGLLIDAVKRERQDFPDRPKVGGVIDPACVFTDDINGELACFRERDFGVSRQ